MHEFLTKIDPCSQEENELQIGHIIQKAIESGQRIAGVHVSEQPIIDVGTPDNFATVLKRLSTDEGC